MATLMARILALSLLCGLLGSSASAQFVGPAPQGRPSTVQEARNAPVDSFVTVTGNIVAHLREDYYTFRDDTGEIRVEIEPPVWKNREVGPDTKVRLLAEVDRGLAGKYLWVKSLDLVDGSSRHSAARGHGTPAGSHPPMRR